jgi:hypothetical protein
LKGSDDSGIYHLPATHAEIKEGHGGSRWFFWLKNVSFGKYRTPLYYKKKDSWSSYFGGVVTLIVMVLIFTFALVTLVPIFQRKTHVFNY